MRIDQNFCDMWAQFTEAVKYQPSKLIKFQKIIDGALFTAVKIDTPQELRNMGAEYLKLNAPFLKIFNPKFSEYPKHILLMQVKKGQCIGEVAAVPYFDLNQRSWIKLIYKDSDKDSPLYQENQTRFSIFPEGNEDQVFSLPPFPAECFSASPIRDKCLSANTPNQIVTQISMILPKNLLLYSSFISTFAFTIFSLAASTYAMAPTIHHRDRMKGFLLSGLLTIGSMASLYLCIQSLKIPE